MDTAAIGEIIKLYKKHGWTLRRVLLSAALSKKLGSESHEIFAGAEISESKLNALWFSRSSNPGLEAWEIRHLSPSPFALVEVMDADEQDEERFSAAEAKMLEVVNRKKSGH